MKAAAQVLALLVAFAVAASAGRPFDAASFLADGTWQFIVHSEGKPVEPRLFLNMTSDAEAGLADGPAVADDDRSSQVFWLATTAGVTTNHTDFRIMPAVAGESEEFGGAKASAAALPPAVAVEGLQFSEVLTDVFTAAGTSKSGEAVTVTFVAPDAVVVAIEGGEGGAWRATGRRTPPEVNQPWWRRYGPIMLMGSMVLLQMGLRVYCGKDQLSRHMTKKRAEYAAKEEAESKKQD